MLKRNFQYKMNDCGRGENKESGYCVIGPLRTILLSYDKPEM